jgi:hypothetical protein
MANFKVPKSPQRNIFAIDNFLGVDLTNTETSIDEVRSPNAENMVRWTPGKVRKRTGYKTKYHFGKGTDVNRAAGTTDEWVQLFVDNDDDVIYNLYVDSIPVFYIHFFYRLSGSYSIDLEFADGTSDGSMIYEAVEEDEYSEFEYNGAAHGGLKRLKIMKLSSELPNVYFYISSVMVCDSTEAITQEAWNEVPWSAAPEDSDIIYVTTGANTSSIYGYHRLKTGTVTGSRVVNVNRVLNTSDEFDTFSVSGRGWLKAYSLGENLYKNETDYPDGLDIYVSFDYMSDNDVQMRLYGHVFPDYTMLHNTNGATEHKEFHVKYGAYSGGEPRVTLRILRTGETATVKIKNMSVVYEKNDDFEWSAAPEDSNATFHLEDIYNIGTRNWSAVRAYGNTITTSSYGQAEEYIKIRNNDKFKGFVMLSFDLTAGASDINRIDVLLRDQDDEDSASIIDTTDQAINNKHYRLIVSGDTADDWVKYIGILFDAPNGTECTYRFANIKLNEISPKSDYGYSAATYIYHIGGRFYSRKSNSDKFNLIYSEANKRRSQSWQIDEKLIIVDGKDIYKYPKNASHPDEITVYSDNKGYTPLITIAKSPSGGGTAYEPFNMLQSEFEEKFTVDSDSASAVDFQLSFGDLDATEVYAEILDSNGEWNGLTEDVDFTVDRQTGVVTFVTAPGVTPITGEDNVMIRASKTIQGYKERVARCTFGILYGVGGVSDRLFLSGNPDYPNWDFFSEQNDPSYFPDINYSVLGSKASAIVGYAIVNNYLATFKDEYDTQRSVFIREGTFIKNEATNIDEPVFRIVNTLQGNGAIATYAFGNLQTEPLFLTREGIYAITPQDITGKEYSQNRSFYLNGSLTKEEHLEDAIATVYKDQYILAVNNKLYILDGLQATRTDRAEPYSTRQYAGFYCTNIPALTMWVEDQALWVGTEDGRMCRFETDIDNLESYNDDGRAIYSCWETPDLDGRLFYKNKTFKYFAIRLKGTYRTSFGLLVKMFGSWRRIFEKTILQRSFDFNNVDFANFTFALDVSNRVAHTKVRVRKVDKARFKVENGELNEPFGLVDLALEYTETSNYIRRE